MNFSLSSSRAPTGSSVGALVLPQANSSRRRLRLWIVWLTLSLVCGFLDWNRVQGIGFSAFDSYFYQMQVRLSAHRNQGLLDEVRKQIVVVPLTDYTFSSDNPEQIPVGPPAPRDVHARVLKGLKAAGARAVVFDIVFKMPGDPQADGALVAAANKPGAPVFWASLIEDEVQEQKPRVSLPLPQLFDASPRLGHILSPHDSDGVSSIQTAYAPSAFELTDEQNRTYRLENQNLPSLSVAAATVGKHEGETLQETAIGWRIGSLHLPKVFKIQFVSDADEDSNNHFATIPFEQVASGSVFEDPLYTKNHFFRNKIVVIGDQTKLGNDFRNTPVGVLSGVEIQANAIASVLLAQSGSLPLAWSVSALAAFGILSALCGLTVLVAARFSSVRGALGVIGILLGYLVIVAVVFVDHGLILHTTGPSVAVVLAALLVFFERGLWEEREKIYVRGLLGRYVSPSVADFILRHPDRCALGGEEVTATVLFADIRGFTALTEHFPPRVTLGLLNDYFQAMSQVVFTHDGMVDKFIGDAIMAIFGAPVPTDDHAPRALSAAAQMLERLEELQAHWQSQGLPPIRIGIGIATGIMIVGNMGSEVRADFSVVGDAVNLAARLQSINKELGTTILISSATRAACDGATFPSWILIEEARRVHVRGHALEEEVFAVRVEPVRHI